MLPICLGEATKFSQYLLEADKRYEVTAKLGERTNTSDSDGEVVSTRPVNVAVGTLIEALDQFRGPIMQVPSMYSALKHNGRPLYEYAREGIEIEREARPITMFELKLSALKGMRSSWRCTAARVPISAPWWTIWGSAGLWRARHPVASHPGGQLSL
jgi:tRNA pseudouridine55 synthase